MQLTGQDTTANAITWMVKYLGENQEALNLVKVFIILPIIFQCKAFHILVKSF